MAMPRCLPQLPPLAQLALTTVRAGVAAQVWDALVPEMDAIYELAVAGEQAAAIERAGDVCEQFGLPREQLRAMVQRFLCPSHASS